MSTNKIHADEQMQMIYRMQQETSEKENLYLEVVKM